VQSLPDKEPKNVPFIFAYAIGLMTAVVIFSLFCIWVIIRIGGTPTSKNFSLLVFPWKQEKVIDIPQDVLEELTQISAVVSNANNPTKQPRHNTIFVHPDEKMGFVIKPNVQISAHMLTSIKAYNFDPPVLHYIHGEQFSERLKAFQTRTSRLNYKYSSDANGFRKTLPDVNADRQVLIIGDSVSFGVGVSDEFTVASYLQKFLGEQYKIINASVGGYNGQQAYLTAKKMSENKKFAGLIYIACQNDFTEGDDWSLPATDVLSKIESISDRFNNNIIVILQTYMEYNLRDIFLEYGWSEKRIQKTHSLRRALPEICAKRGFGYYDWTDIVSDFMKEEKSIFSRFALYVDHVHLSPLGNRLLAEKLLNTINNFALDIDGGDGIDSASTSSKVGQ
jgi:lysophospholipase L1-like esterase